MVWFIFEDEDGYAKLITLKRGPGIGLKTLNFVIDLQIIFNLKVFQFRRPRAMSGGFSRDRTSSILGVWAAQGGVEIP